MSGCDFINCVSTGYKKIEDITYYDLLKVWGPNGENWPKDAVRDLDTLAKLLHWSR